MYDSGKIERILVRIAIETDVAVLVAHHFRKGLAEAGNIDAARGARAIIDASRLALTLVPMSGDEAKRFNINKQERRRLVRMDDGKNNLRSAARSSTFPLRSRRNRTDSSRGHRSSGSAWAMPPHAGLREVMRTCPVGARGSASRTTLGSSALS